MDQLLLLGRQASQLGQVVHGHLDGAHLCISVGSDPDSPAKVFKASLDFPNEDAALVIRQEQHWLLAVADGHLGHELSHHLLQELSQIKQVPMRLGQLSLWLAGQNLELLSGGSALLVACLNQATGSVFGLSFGDCSLVRLSAAGFKLHNQHNEHYLRGGLSPAVELGLPFQFTLEEQETLLLYTDGINECCYRDPLRSLQSKHILQLYRQHGSDTQRLVSDLAELALTGVEGHPGGQDNLALVALSR